MSMKETHEFHANLSFRYILFHEKIHFLILAEEVHFTKMIRAGTALIIFGEMHFRKCVFNFL